jgi:DNA-binding transcriptional LysR family regulator
MQPSLQAIFGLRVEFDNELYVRDGRGVSLTPRGRHLAGISAEILGLAEHARRTTNDAQGLWDCFASPPPGQLPSTSSRLSSRPSHVACPVWKSRSGSILRGVSESCSDCGAPT